MEQCWVWMSTASSNDLEQKQQRERRDGWEPRVQRSQYFVAHLNSSWWTSSAIYKNCTNHCSVELHVELVLWHLVAPGWHLHAEQLELYVWCSNGFVSYLLAMKAFKVLLEPDQFCAPHGENQGEPLKKEEMKKFDIDSHVISNVVPMIGECCELNSSSFGELKKLTMLPLFFLKNLVICRLPVPFLFTAW